MRFPIAIFKGEGTDYDVIVPDVTGCFSGGSTVDQAMDNAREAIEQHVELSVERNLSVDFIPSRIEDLKDVEDYAEAVMWAFVTVDDAIFDVKPERVNISMPRPMLRRIDAFADSHRETRSGFLMRAALELIRNEEQKIAAAA